MGGACQTPGAERDPGHRVREEVDKVDAEGIKNADWIGLNWILTRGRTPCHTFCVLWFESSLRLANYLLQNVLPIFSQLEGKALMETCLRSSSSSLSSFTTGGIS